MSERQKSHPSKNISIDSKDIFSNLEKESDLFAKMINQIGDELMVIRGDGRIVYVNEATVHGLKYSRSVILKKHINDFFKEKISIKKWESTYFSGLKKKKKPLSFVLDRIVKGGVVQTIEIKAVYMRYKCEDYILSIARDITDQLTMQSHLKESEDRYRLLAEGAADGIFTTDLGGKITYLNHAAVRLVNIPEDQLIGQHFRKVIHEDSLAKASSCFNKAKKGISQIREEVEIIDKHGRVIPVEVTISPLYKGEKIITIHGIVRDVRTRKQLENYARESEKEKALSHFVYGMAQEIRSPLQSVIEHTGRVADKYKHRDFEYIGYKEFREMIQAIESINNQVRYCCDTVNRLLTFQKKRVGIKSNRCDVNAMIKEIVVLISDQLKLRDIKLHLKLTPNLPSVAIDPIEWNQVINNVIANAQESMPAGGLLVVSTLYNPRSRKVTVIFKDNGIGIQKENLQRIFDPFFTTKKRGLGQNSGLGLSIVYKIIKRYKGDIAIESNLRSGTLVKIDLPAVKQ